MNQSKRTVMKLFKNYNVNNSEISRKEQEICTSLEYKHISRCQGNNFPQLAIYLFS